MELLFTIVWTVWYFESWWRLSLISSGLRDYAYSLFDSRKNLIKQQNLSEKSKFLDEYINNISIESDVPFDKCTWWYNTIDNISFANDFPTALTIAIWYRESNCWYYLPSNWDGPFQIVSKDYGVWEITEKIFKQTIQDFIDFTKWKIDNYNKKVSVESEKIKVSYTWFDYTWIISTAALYNWWTITWWMVQPNSPKYVFDGYGESYSGSKKYWVFPMFLKMLEWEIDK